MIGELDFSKKKVTVIGAGIAGLLIAYRLNQMGFEVTLLEQNKRWGGLIATQKTSNGPIEKAAHSLLVSPEVEALFQELEIPLIAVKSRSRRIWRNGRGRKYPLTVLETLGMLKRLLFAVAPAKADSLDWTLQHWARHHLGDAAHDYLFQPMIQGIYGCGTEKLLIREVFPALHVPSGRRALSHWIRSGVFRNRVKKRLMAPRAGMQSLVDALGTRLQASLGDRFVLGRALGSLAELSDRLDRNLVLCVPAAEAARLLASESPECAQALAEIPYSSLGSATVFVKRDLLPSFQEGVGVLIPAVESTDGCLGVLTNSSAFDDRARVGEESLSIFFDTEPDFALVLKRIYGFLGDEVLAHSVYWKRAVPQAGKALALAHRVARESWCSKPGQILFGNYTGQVSIRGMIESVTKTPGALSRPRGP